MSFHDRITNLPSFDELPQIDDLPKGCTWGLWDKDGKKDELGTLNLLTPEVVKEAFKELSEGISVCLTWSLDKPNAPNFHRKPLDHKLIDHSTFSPYSGFDDEVHLNTQCSSQWDGLRHHSQGQTKLFYNNVKKDEFGTSNVLGIDRWSTRGGIVGRGVLIDYVAYAARHNIAYSAVECHSITHTALEAAAREQGVAFKQGDILLVRSGFTKWYNETPDAKERDRVTSSQFTFAGVTPMPESVRWMWERHFAAVAGDALAFESLPYQDNGLLFHDFFLSLWGTPIGEAWDLEKLAETCERLGRWSFLLTSAPLNVPGGVASPPNAIAIF
ncbi:uncharacterized protein BDZ99DRAFT_416493 [Mytilinidion resinicola]|uniref:Cyclase n=1 Tax=Mytilinidion resinicola TaxID=574789 RepID=A0A6A6YQW5_9PEZI|nr:uncharacterized protein BDZ99DRAFT_416493 [Mytilinidion resinicola]KAF2810267.1 hypothetical protein BDZ99DRAFT_416493 [Mytilinidion resinicola]